MADNFTKYLRGIFSMNPSENGKTILLYSFLRHAGKFRDLEKAFKKFRSGQD